MFAVCLTWYHFWEETLRKFLIFNYILDCIYSKFNQTRCSTAEKSGKIDLGLLMEQFYEFFVQR